MKQKFVLFFLTSIVVFSCEYKRQQDIPKNIKVKFKESCSISGSYSINRYELQGFDKNNIEDWRERLTCEGYSDSKSILKMTDFSLISKNEKESLSHLFNNTLICGNLKIELNQIKNAWVSACRTENKSSWTDNKFDYQMITLIDTENSIMYEIKYLL